MSFKDLNLLHLIFPCCLPLLCGPHWWRYTWAGRHRCHRPGDEFDCRAAVGERSWHTPTAKHTHTDIQTSRLNLLIKTCTVVSWSVLIKNLNVRSKTPIHTSFINERTEWNRNCYPNELIQIFIMFYWCHMVLMKRNKRALLWVMWAVVQFSVSSQEL